MKDQINTIREALAVLEAIGENDMYAEEWQKTKQAVTALSELEAMAGEPVAWMVTTELQDGTRRTYPLSGRYKDVRDACDFGEPVPLYAAPPAQQPQYEAGDMASAAAQGFRDGVASVAQQPQEPVGEVVQAFADLTAISWADNGGKFPPVGTKLYTAPVAQQPQEIEVQCPVCNHKFYEWPNDKQPQAEPNSITFYEQPGAEVLRIGPDGRLFWRGREIETDAEVREAMLDVRAMLSRAMTPQQVKAVPPGYVMVPVDVLKAASESLGSFVSDQGWTTLDMQALDNIDAILAQQKGGV